MAEQEQQGVRKTEDTYDAGHVPMTEEFDRAKWTLPPLGIVVIALVAVALIVGVIAWVKQPKPASAGSIDDMVALPTTDGSTVVAMNVTFRNIGGRPLYIKNVTSNVKTDQGDKEAVTANAVDFDRYFQAYPELGSKAMKPVRVETRVPAGLQDQGTLIFRYPIPIDQFNARKSLEVVIHLYDQKPLVLTR